MPGRVVAIHGFTQTGRSWPRQIVERLEAGGHEVLTPDQPGHGSAKAVRANLVEGAALLAELGPATYVGYSLGGRLALHVAVHHPAAVERLVLIGATAGIEDDHERAARKLADDELAATIQRDGVDAFLVRWLSNPLFASLPAEASGIEYRRENTPEGLAASLRLMGAGTQQPLWSRLGQLTVPVLFLVGELDEKFTALAMRMADAWGGPARVEVVQHAGHAVHLEQPVEVAEAIAAFVGDVDAGGDGHDDSTSATASTAP
jgi:2-succinyl-6-hydroxy-2,4-cyclohexadiene-1-carboxylate synthase